MSPLGLNGEEIYDGRKGDERVLQRSCILVCRNESPAHPTLTYLHFTCQLLRLPLSMASPIFFTATVC